MVGIRSVSYYKSLSLTCKKCFLGKGRLAFNPPQKHFITGNFRIVGDHAHAKDKSGERLPCLTNAIIRFFLKKNQTFLDNMFFFCVYFYDSTLKACLFWV